MADGGAYDMIDQIDQKHTAGHVRHREILTGFGQRLEEAEDRLAKLERSVVISEKAFTELSERKIEAANVRFTPAMVIGLVLFTASLVGGQKWATAGLAEQQAATSATVTVLNVKMDALKQHSDDNMKLQDERAANWSREIARISGQATMIDTKLSNLRETTIANAARR